ncbi:MAG: phosphatidate cytidylyltransferase [Chitinophagales bacterium]|jgi:phosphatidate cytidylyltransferase|nr:phosphatidate cytidylyltransferase [Chitinophagales bacterium]
MKTFWIRSASALIFAAIILTGFLGSFESFSLLTFLILLGCHYEFYQIARPKFKKDKSNIVIYRSVQFFISIVSYLLTLVVVYFQDNYNLLLFLPSLLFLFFIIELILKFTNPLRSIGINLLAYCYITIPLLLSLYLSFYQGSYHGGMMLGILFVIWANDSGAYLVGSMIGKKKIFPNISPNKSLEGFIGGLFFSLLFAYLNRNYIYKIPYFETIEALSMTKWYLIAIVVFFFATIGDLVESMFKRALDIKDSGSIMPGHGGFLDRFDAYLFVLPFIAIVVFLVIV